MRSLNGVRELTLIQADHGALSTGAAAFLLHGPNFLVIIAPEQVKVTQHHSGCSCLPTRAVIHHLVVLEPIGAPFVPSFPRAHLRQASRALDLGLGLSLGCIQIVQQGLLGQANAILP